MVAWLEVELARSPHLTHDLGVLLGVAVGDGRVGEVRERGQQALDGRVDLRQFLLEALDLIAQPPGLLRVAPSPLAPASQLLDPGQESPALAVELEQFVDSLGRPPASQRRLDALGIATDQLEV